MQTIDHAELLRRRRAAWRAFEKEVERDHDWIAFAQFVLLIGLGAALSVVPVPTSR